MIVVVDKNLTSFEMIQETSFHDLNVWERLHIQEWIRQSPEILGEDLLIVSIEFDRFQNSSGRIDMLAIDRFGNLVVIELKRDSFAGYADLQAIRYAAMVSSMTMSKLLPYFNNYRVKHEKHEKATDEELQDIIREFVSETEEIIELSDRPRIILCSEDFSQEITNTVLWLNQTGLDISCIKIKPHKVDDRIIIVSSKIIPLPEAKDYLIDIQQKAEEKQRTQAGRRPRTMRVIVENGLLNAGEEIYLKKDLPEYMAFEEGNSMYTAEIVGDSWGNKSVRWKHDGKTYAISKLTWKIFKNCHPNRKNPGGVNGNSYWVTRDGHSLWEIASRWLQENNGLQVEEESIED